MNAPARITEALRSRELRSAARELFAAHPSGDVLVVVGPGVDVPEALGATAPAGDLRASLSPLARGLEIARARSESAARDLEDPPPAGSVRVLYLDSHRACVVGSLPGAAFGRPSFDAPKGAA